jgi:hypothetical protein
MTPLNRKISFDRSEEMCYGITTISIIAGYTQLVKQRRLRHRVFAKSFDEPLACHPERSEGSRHRDKEILHSSALAAQMQVSFRMT